MSEERLAGSPAATMVRESAPGAVEAGVYHDADLYRQEQERLFRGPVWCYVGLEAEIPKAGDFRSTFIGETPVVVCRDEQGALHCWVNRCAHKGALVCRSPKGNARDGAFVCVYHQWAYDASGALRSVPFRRGMQGYGGMPADFDMAQHGLQRLRVATMSGLIFASFDARAPELETFLGPVMCANIRRILHKPIRILGHARQFMQGNWKLYSENSRDGYHGGLLHLFYPTFGIYRQSQDSEGEIDATYGFHNLFTVRLPRQSVAFENYGKEAQRSMQGSAVLQDPRVIEFRPELNDDVALSIQSLFPSVVLQQIQNTLATRQIIPRGVDGTELVWTYFGFADDDPDMTRHRLRNLNLVGPAGYISMEDGEAVEICQRGTGDVIDLKTLIRMGESIEGRRVSPIGVDENAVRGFWRGYLSLMQPGRPS